MYSSRNDLRMNCVLRVRSLRVIPPLPAVKREKGKVINSRFYAISIAF